MHTHPATQDNSNVIDKDSHGAIPPPNPAEPSPFALPDPADLERRLRSAGFSEARSERVEFAHVYPSFDEYWAETMDLAAPVADAVAGLSPAGVEAVRASTRDTLSQFMAPDGQIETTGIPGPAA